MATIGLLQPFSAITKNMILKIHDNVDLNTLCAGKVYSVELGNSIVRGRLKSQHDVMGLYYFEFMHRNALHRIKIIASGESIVKMCSEIHKRRKFIDLKAEKPYELTIDGMVYTCHVHGTGKVPFEESFFTISDNGIQIYVSKDDEDLIKHRKERMTKIDVSIPVVGKVSDDSDIVFLNEDIPQLSYRETYVVQRGDEFVEAELVESLTGHPKFKSDWVDAYAVAHETSINIK